MGNNYAAADTDSEFWKAWKVTADNDADAAALLNSPNAPAGSDITAVVRDDIDSLVGVRKEQKDGAGYYAFQTVLNKANEKTFFPFYDGEELSIYDGEGKPFRFVGVTFDGKINARLVGLCISDDADTFVYRVPEPQGEIDGRFDMFGFTDGQAEALEHIFTFAEKKENISFTLLIASENVDDLSVGGFFELSPRSMENVPTPEPATMLVIGLGIAGLGIARRRMIR